MLTKLLPYFPDLSDKQQNQFAALGEQYSYWNERINVISRKDIEFLADRHVLHSLGVAKVINFEAGSRVLDIGTGGGFPLIPLAILFPDTEFIGIDGIGKKIRVVREIGQAIGLENMEAHALRAEEAPKRSFDFVTCRAVTSIDRLLAWSDPLLSSNSQHSLPNGLLALKGGDLTEELALIPSNRPVKQYSLANYFTDPFFEWKSVVYVG
jgi:16S rRNA (guanine527-N7)-methyltransferase